MDQLTDEQVERRLSEALANRSSVPAEKLIAGLLRTFKLTADADDEFLYPALSSTARERIFGGQVIAQAIVTADHTVDEEKTIHSLHSYFLRAGDETKPLHFRVHRDFDGRSISNRRVVVRQDDKVIFNLTASFQKPADGLHHQVPMPDVLPPDQCMSMMEQIARNPQVSDKHIERMSMPRPFDVRSFRPEGKSQPARQYQWFKTVAPLPDDPLTHRATLAFASDMGLLSTSMIPHGLHWTTPGLFSTSLDHAMWFHDDFRMDQWICYVMDSDWTGGTRGLNRGSLYTQDGKLVASAVQEGLIRVTPKSG
ncbi:acyl-CoA thioesterase II [Sphingorhabdus sp. EL138]|uniref:acyl-CoA thioesterase n=1 Tax=Sphingorhabdus sp. EL138 TaxID=2073156 RepID=UPI000D69A101|nr:acyl-CoA thioesterase II [Sphingorhabdus sp. EL138]